VEYLNPDEAFILIVTDGSVSEAEQAAAQIFNLAKKNRVIIGLVTQSPGDAVLKQQMMKFNHQKGIYMFAVKPEEAGKLVLQDLLKKQATQGMAV
jgi:hypothetical protein